MCCPWLEHVKNTTTPHPSIYSILPSVSPFCPSLPFCAFFLPWASLLSIFCLNDERFYFPCIFYQIPLLLAIFCLFFGHRFWAPCLIIALLSLITTSCLGEWCRLPGVSPSPSDTVTLAALQSINKVLSGCNWKQKNDQISWALCCLLASHNIDTEHVHKYLWWFSA